MTYNKIIANLRQIWAHLRTNGLELADFEDAINEAIELVKKKRDGLLIEIPCKVGDTVYRIDTLTIIRRSNPMIIIEAIINSVKAIFKPIIQGLVWLITARDCKHCKHFEINPSMSVKRRDQCAKYNKCVYDTKCYNTITRKDFERKCYIKEG